jgi:hypothetical protein
MSGPDTKWQAALIDRYPGLFNQEINGRVTVPGYPEVGDGWRSLVETAIGRIATAIAAAPNSSLRIGQIKEKFGGLRLYLHGDVGLSDTIVAAIDEAIKLAEARSACTCETCGAEGRLFKRGGRLLTACDEHGKGTPVHQKAGLKNLHITRAYVGGKRVVRARRYVRDTDSFIDVDPSSFNLDEE